MIARKRLERPASKPASVQDHIQVLSGRWVYRGLSEEGTAQAVRVLYVRNGKTGICHASSMMSGDVERAIKRVEQ